MEAIKDLLKYKDKFEKFILIIRHSNREKIPDGVHDIVTPINDVGRTNAQNVGQLISAFSIKNIYTSPVERCVQTSKNIEIGYKNKISIQKSNMLGEPGPFVFDRNVAREHFIKFTTKIVVEKQIAGEKLEGIRMLEEASNYFKKFIFSELDRLEKNKITIMVTHDAILAPFIYSLSGEKFGRENWVDFLDGVIIAKSDNKYYAIRKNCIYEIN